MDFKKELAREKELNIKIDDLLTFYKLLTSNKKTRLKEANKIFAKIRPMYLKMHPIRHKHHKKKVK